MFFDLFRRKRVNNSTIKSDCDKVAKRIKRETIKKLKKGMLPDGHSLAEHLKYVDKDYSHIKEDIKNTTLVFNYQTIRSERYSATEQMLDFYQVRYDELQNMYKNVAQVAKDTGNQSELSSEKLSTIDMAKLRKKFEALNRSERDWSSIEPRKEQHVTTSSSVNTPNANERIKIPIADVQRRVVTSSLVTAEKRES